MHGTATVVADDTEPETTSMHQTRLRHVRPVFSPMSFVTLDCFRRIASLLAQHILPLSWGHEWGVPNVIGLCSGILAAAYLHYMRQYQPHRLPKRPREKVSRPTITRPRIRMRVVSPVKPADSARSIRPQFSQVTPSAAKVMGSPKVPTPRAEPTPALASSATPRALNSNVAVAPTSTCARQREMQRKYMLYNSHYV